VLQPLLFVNSLVGTMNEFTTANIEEFFSSVIVSRLNDYLGEHLQSLFDLPGQYSEMAQELARILLEDFSHFGIGLPQFYINSITPPQEVQKAIDDKSKLGLFKNLDDLMRLKAASAMEKAAENPGAPGAGMGAGLGMMMPAMLMQQYGGGFPAPGEVQKCHECGGQIPANAQFCPLCGHQLVIFSQCRQCGKNLPPSAFFCPRCGTAVEKAPQKKSCGKCGYENLFNSIFCNQCGERLA
jgi:membrane protease subunit (stomatin/prohibitin family)